MVRLWLLLLPCALSFTEKTALLPSLRKSRHSAASFCRFIPRAVSFLENSNDESNSYVIPTSNDDDDDDDDDDNGGGGSADNGGGVASPAIILAYERAVQGIEDNESLEAFIIATPFIAPLVAFFTYTNVASFYRTVIAAIDFNRAWYPVDGQAYQIAILSPTIIGIIVPTITILFATLVSVTVSTLRQRQLDIRTSLNNEACDIRRLQMTLTSLYDALPPSEALRTARGLERYVSRILGESRRGVSVVALEFVGVADSELSAIGTVLHGMIRGDYRPVLVAEEEGKGGEEKEVEAGEERSGAGGSGAAAESYEANSAAATATAAVTAEAERGPSSDFLSTTTTTATMTTTATAADVEYYDRVARSVLVDEALGTVSSLNMHRSARLSALQAGFPPIHFAVLGTLGFSIITVFLMETDQETLAFLSAVQLKILFSILVGVFTSMAVLISDLQDPFRGSYLITPTIAQLFVIREAMTVDRSQIEEDATGVGLLQWRQRRRQRRRRAGLDGSESASREAREAAAGGAGGSQQQGGWGGSYFDQWQGQWQQYESEAKRKRPGPAAYMKSLASGGGGGDGGGGAKEKEKKDQKGKGKGTWTIF
jgi:hypothetical protein